MLNFWSSRSNSSLPSSEKNVFSGCAAMGFEARGKTGIMCKYWVKITIQYSFERQL